MIDFIKRLVNLLKEEPIDNELLNFAKREYPRDWEHAYHMLINGKRPFSGV